MIRDHFHGLPELEGGETEGSGTEPLVQRAKGSSGAPEIEKHLADVEEEIKRAFCPRCNGQLVHDFEGECWVQDRCTSCEATWFNDPPRLAQDAPHFYRVTNSIRLLKALRLALAQRDSLVKQVADFEGQSRAVASGMAVFRNTQILIALEGK